MAVMILKMQNAEVEGKEEEDRQKESKDIICMSFKFPCKA